MQWTSLRIKVLIAACVRGLSLSNRFSRSRLRSQLGFFGCMLSRSSSCFRRRASSAIVSRARVAVAFSTVSSSSTALMCLRAWPVDGSYALNLNWRLRIAQCKQCAQVSLCARVTHRAAFASGASDPSSACPAVPASASALRFLQQNDRH